MNQIDHSSLCGRHLTFPRWPPCGCVASLYISQLCPVSFTLRDGFYTHHLVGHFCKLFSEMFASMSVQNKAAILFFLLFWMFYTKKLFRFASSFSYICFGKYWYWNFLLPQTCHFVNAFVFCDEIASVSVIIININIIIIIWNGHLSSLCERVLLAPFFKKNCTC